MSICDPEEGMHRLFRGVVPEQFVVDLPDTAEHKAALDRLLKEKSEEIAAIIIEPLVQGAGGMKFHDATVLAGLKNLAQQHNVLLIFDEIFTGFGRTGSMFACQQTDVTPDIICLGKALTGGTVPLAATVATDLVFNAFLSEDVNNPHSADAALMHGPTYMAYPLGCAAANASLDLFESDPRLQQARAIEAQLAGELADCKSAPNVRDVRVRGAIAAVQMTTAIDAVKSRSRFIEKGCWIKPFGDVIYLTPPFVIEPNDLSKLTRAILEEVHGK
jgi:adenosylmethionine-8-amino-7-oxononanoate aminotransferase